MILKVAADSRQRYCRLDANLPQLTRIPDPRSQKDCRRAICSTRDDEPRRGNLAGTVGPDVMDAGRQPVLDYEAIGR